MADTCFFRDRACFDALERHVLPALIAARRDAGIRRLRLWSAGWALTILATDINPEALETAERGIHRAKTS